MHFNPELLDYISEELNFDFSQEFFDFLGMFAYEFFVEMFLWALILFFANGGQYWIFWAILGGPLVALQIEEWTAPYINYTGYGMFSMFVAEGIHNWLTTWDTEIFFWIEIFDAVYKWLMYAILSGQSIIPDFGEMNWPGATKNEDWQEPE